MYEPSEDLIQKIWTAGNQSKTAVQAVLEAIESAGYVLIEKSRTVHTPRDMTKARCSECRAADFHKMDCSKNFPLRAGETVVKRPNCF